MPDAPLNLPHFSTLSSLLESLPAEQAAELESRCREMVSWAPNAGPQGRAYINPADELYYGGAAGGGKTQLGVGLSLYSHRNTLFLRRQQTDAKAISDVYKSLPTSVGSWKGSGYGGEFRTSDGRLVEVNGCQREDDWKKYAGHAHDLKLFDELPQFSQKQFGTITAWNRVRDPLRFPDQRCRVVGLGNPPTDPQGEWVLRYWSAWLDPSAGQVAEPGELRWYVRVDGEDDPKPVADASPVTFKDKTYQPRSRTFIPARVEDNPAYMAQGYDAVLNALPEPLRSQLRYGDMLAARQDDRWQLIPTKWVVESNRRWVQRKDKPGPLAAVGVDVAMSQGEGDQTVIAARCGEKEPEHGAFIRPLLKRKGRETPDGQSVVKLVMSTAWGEEGVPVNIDAIGIGKSAVDVAAVMGLKNVVPVVVSNSANWSDRRFPQLRFANTRAAMMWRVRALLDPEGGPPETRLALPPDPELLADLTAPRYSMRVSGIVVESKEEIRKRIGRSTDCGDSVGLACWQRPGYIAVVF